MIVLAIETSCDETSAAVVQDGRNVMSCIIASSQSAFEQAGGVIPEEAAREQVLCILPVIHQAMEAATCAQSDLDAIAVTYGPGLLGSLLVGTTTARTLARLWHKPLIGVHHTLGHLSSVWLDVPTEDCPHFPILTLSASGGHTDLWLRTSHLSGRLIGRTRDDAAGEAFDKGAQLLGLGYPGGPAVAKLAEGGNPDTYAFPLPLKQEDSLDFSFSGLKTSLRYLLRDTPDYSPADAAASYQAALCRHLIDRIVGAIDRHPEVREIHLVGGVSANTTLRTMLADALPSVRLRFPSKLVYCTDNAAMIGAAAHAMVEEMSEEAFAPFETHASLPLASAVMSDEL